MTYDEAIKADYTVALKIGIRRHEHSKLCLLDLPEDSGHSSLLFFEGQHGYFDGDVKITWQDINRYYMPNDADRKNLATRFTVRDFIDTDSMHLRDPDQIGGAEGLLTSRAAIYGEAFAKEVEAKYGPFIDGMTIFSFEPLRLITLGIINDGVTHRMAFDYTFKIGFKEDTSVHQD